MVSGRYLGQDDSIRVNGQIGLKPLLIRYFNIKGFISKHQDTKKKVVEQPVIYQVLHCFHLFQE